MLLAESRALKDPFGVMTLQIHPTHYTGIAADTEVLKATLRQDIRDFFKAVAKGDADDEAKMNAAVFDGDAFKPNRDYLWSRTQASATQPDYGDAHALSVRQDDNTPALAGIIVMPRAAQPFEANAQNATGLKKEQFAPAAAPAEQLTFMTVWHEFAHTTGADEAQADKMSAIMTRKAFPGSNALQVYADLRAIDSLLDYDSKGNGSRPARHEIYGWRLVDAIDGVAKMPEQQIQAMDEKAIRKLTETPIPHTRYDALRRVGEALREENPDLVNYKTANILDTGAALKKMLEDGKFDNDPEAQTIAKRSLLAISRVALNGAYLSPDVGMTSRFMGQKADTQPPQKPPLRAPSP